MRDLLLAQETGVWKPAVPKPTSEATMRISSTLSGRRPTALRRQIVHENMIRQGTGPISDTRPEG